MHLGHSGFPVAVSAEGRELRAEQAEPGSRRVPQSLRALGSNHTPPLSPPPGFHLTFCGVSAPAVTTATAAPHPSSCGRSGCGATAASRAGILIRVLVSAAGLEELVSV